ncbi:MAG: hypothetical protein PQJ59_15985 [Spirochaetales bacterium]|nr:hypothetical protein [Spirochaetales bacterium]
MNKNISSDWEICLSIKKQPLPLSQGIKNYSFMDELFDKNGFFLEKKLLESVKKRENTYFELARSEYKEARYLGLAGLLALGNEKYDHLLWEAFNDSYHFIRVMVVTKWEHRERSRLFNEIFRRLTGDPRQLIRDGAYRRIKKDFSDLFSFRINNFPPDEQYRLIMFLETGTTQDEGILADFIQGEQEDLAARALYKFQKKKASPLNKWPVQSQNLSLTRFDYLSPATHVSEADFFQAFQLLDEHTPPVLASQFMTELIKRPFHEDWKPLYKKMMKLIGRLKGPRTRTLLELIEKHEDLKRNISEFWPEAFTYNNHYYTFDLQDNYS